MTLFWKISLNVTFDHIYSTTVLYDILSKVEFLEVKGQLVLIGGGTDGATVNVSDQNGLKGKLKHGCSGHGALHIA